MLNDVLYFRPGKSGSILTANISYFHSVSLSPSQQRFAKAFRGMQLESSLFGVLVLQIKPQLETLLKLEPEALTKEIALTQSLMDLFVSS